MTETLFAPGSIYLCTGLRPSLEHFVAECISGGVAVVQLREKAAPDGQILKAAKSLAKLCRDLGVPFILNDRPDIALLSGADGVHIGQDDLPVSTVRELLGKDAIVGLSTHETSELLASMAEEVDYISVGPVVETPTKPGRQGTSLAYVDFAAQNSTKSFFVTGGVQPDNIDELVLHGARHFVVVRYLSEASNPRSAATRLREAVDEALQRTTATRSEGTDR